MRWAGLLLVFIRAFFIDRNKLALEAVALRQQLANYKLKKRPKLGRLDRLFWIVLSKIWGNWKSALAIVKPETVIEWHRKGFKLFWKMKSQKPAKAGRPKISREARKLIARLTRENPTWGAPRIVKEMKLLNFDISESSVHRYRDRTGKPPSQTWKTFLKNHAKETVSIDFLVMPTITFSMLYVFVILDNSRRKILHFNITSNPTARWTANQIKEAFPWDTRAEVSDQ